MSDTQNYENYYREYFKSAGGAQALIRARARYWAKLRKQYPGLGINKAARLLRESRKKPS